MQSAEEPIATAAPDRRTAWIMLFALGAAFSLSQAYRTVGAMMANQLQRDFALSAQQLGLFASIFHFSFGGLQLVMGIGIDFQGVRRTILAAFPLTIAGALLSALAPQYALVVLGQALDRHRLRAGFPGVHRVHRAALSDRRNSLPSPAW